MAIYLNNKIDVIVSKKDKKVYIYDRLKRKEYYITWGIFLYLKILDSEFNNDFCNIDKNKLNMLKKKVEELYLKEILIHNGVRRFNESCRYKLENNPLDVIQIEVTSSCNFNCKHCYNQGNVSSIQLPFDKITEIIDDAVYMGVNRICITGGEPLVRKDIRDILRYIDGKNIECELFTNGFLLDEEYCEFLNDVHVSKMRISLDGKDAETHDTFRNKKGSFNKVINAIKKLKELNIPIEINSVVHRGNINDVKGLCDFFEKELEVKHKLDFVAKIGNAKENYNAISVDIDEYCEGVYPYVKDIVQREKGCKSKNVHYCGIGNTFVYITSDGLVKLCPSIDDKFNYGSIKDKRFKELWTCKMVNKYRNISCKYIDECEYSNICKGGCRNRALLFGNNLDDPDKVFCKLFKVDINPTVR